MRSLCALLAALCLALPVARAQATVDIGAMNEQVDAAFRGAKAVGGAFIVAKGHEIVYERYYGYRHKSTQSIVTPNTYFRCASVSKLVAGIGVMRLMEQGVLAPDEDISAYLGYTVRNPRYMNTPITLRMLMSHTAGLNENSSYSKRSSLLRDMLDVDRKARSNFREVKPGAMYTYSNFGAGVTGSIVESVTGLEFSQFMRQEVFGPLDIDAAYVPTQLESPGDLASSYNKDGSLNVGASYVLSQQYDSEPNPDAHYRMVVGGLYIRPHDLARLGIALCTDGTVDGVRLLSEESLAMMRQEQSEETTGITSKSPYSFFTIRQDTLFAGRRVYGHQGTSEGIICNLYYEPQSELTIVVVSNGCSTTRDDGIMRLTRRLAGYAEEAWLN